MGASGYQDLPAAQALTLHDDRAQLRLVSGSVEGVAPPIRTHTPVQYLDVRLEAGGRAAVPIPAPHNGFVLVVEGSVRVGSERVPATAGQVLWLDYPRAEAADPGVDTLEVLSDAPARVLVVTGTPIREPVVAYGPFVMNTQDEIIAAYRDFHSGRFGGPTPAALALGQARG
jgi:redox-sensitive bicupin YhaK (pirin superfamily)